MMCDDSYGFRTPRPLPDVQTRLNKMLEDNKLRYDLDSPVVSDVLP